MSIVFQPDVSMAIPGFTEPDELEWLGERASLSASVVEIGCWLGRSASALASCPGPVWTVDHFQGSPSERDAAHAEAAGGHIGLAAELNLDVYPNVEILRMTSLEASRKFTDGSVEMVFIDGDHDFEAVLVDLIAWTPKCRGLLCGHDRNWEGVYRALAVYGVPFDIGPGSIWFVERGASVRMTPSPSIL